MMKTYRLKGAFACAHCETNAGFHAESCEEVYAIDGLNDVPPAPISDDSLTKAIGQDFPDFTFNLPAPQPVR